MLKFFTSVIKSPVNRGGSKTILDMQETIRRFLSEQGIEFREISLAGFKNTVLQLAFPSPYSEYLLFGYIGFPFFESLLVIPYCFLFWLIALKKRISREKFSVIIVDLIEWQSCLWIEERSRKARFLRIFQCSLERIMLSHVADEIISSIDVEFIREKYATKCVHRLDFLDYYVSQELCSVDSSRDLKVLYAGDLGRDIDMRVLEGVLKNLDHSYTLSVAGYGLKESWKKRFRKYQNFDYYGQLGVDELDKLARMCRFGLIVYRPEFFYYNLGPTAKLSFYIVNGLTVISTDLKTVKKLNAKYGFGHVLDMKELFQFIRYLPPDKIRRNKELEGKIAKGQFLHNALAEVRFPGEHRA